MRVVWLAVLCGLVACGDDGGVTDGHDLSAVLDDLQVSRDLSLGDQRTPDDLAYDFCADVMAALAGATPTTCASQYLRDFVRCMAPPGHCRLRTADPFHESYCWEDGSAVVSGMNTSQYDLHGGRSGTEECGYSGTHWSRWAPDYASPRPCIHVPRTSMRDG